MSFPSLFSVDDPPQAESPKTAETVTAVKSPGSAPLFTPLGAERSDYLETGGGGLDTVFGLPFFWRSVVLVSFFWSTDDPPQAEIPKIDTTATAAMALYFNICVLPSYVRKGQ